MKMKLLLMGCVLGLVAGCKVAVMVPSGGTVISTNAANNCAERSLCEFDIIAEQLPFSETFTAIPSPGYEFEKWSDGNSFQCANSTSPTCTINLADTAINLAGVALFDSLYLMPIFRDVGFDTDGDSIRDELDEDDDNDGLLDADDPCPFNPDQGCGGDYLIADGKIWFQPDLFTGLTWGAINAVCPAGVCNGILYGYNMNEWRWASSADVLSLFESYGSAGGDFYDCPAVDSFFYDDGWRKTNSYVLMGGSIGVLLDLVGWTSTSGETGFISNNEPFSCSYGAINFSSSGTFNPTGAWFYRTP